MISFFYYFSFAYYTNYLAICGDNITTQGEECDDGNTVNGDGCSANCLIEGLFFCSFYFIYPSTEYLIFQFFSFSFFFLRLF